MASLRLKNAYKLITREDILHFHKTIGTVCFFHYGYRFIRWSIFGPLSVFSCPYRETTFWIVCHTLLSLSSLMFHLPVRRVQGSPVIWPEFRLHSIVFAMRSLLVMLAHMYSPSGWSYTIRSGIVLATLIGADAATLAYKSREKTMRGMPFPKGMSIGTINCINLYYSICQVMATIKMIYAAVDPPCRLTECFFILCPIQMAAFQMTLVKKGIMTTAGWHLYYTFFLTMNYIYAFMVRQDYPIIAATIFFCIMRFRFRINKYVLWSVIALMGKIVK